MYFYHKEEEVLKHFPIFSSKVDCIIDFFSLDLVKDYQFNKALYSLEEEAYNRLLKFTFAGKINKGTIIPYSKSSHLIIHIPFKNKYKEPANESFIKDGLIKLFKNHKKLNINKIGIQETGYIKKEMINKCIEDLNVNFPEIVYFECINFKEIECSKLKKI